MSGASSAAQRRRSQRLLVMGAVVAVVLALLVAVGIYLLLRDGGSHGAAAPSTPAGTTGTHPSADISWAKVAGVELPISRTAGPHTMTAATASGFSDSELGAALAAVHVLIRSSAAAGPNIYGPTITRQVIGANTGAMKLLADQQYQQLRQQAGVPDGAPVVGDAVVRGYRSGAFSAGKAATVQVYLASAQLAAQSQLLQFDIQLLRADGDWRVVAPPGGDWGSASTTLASAPGGMLGYDESR